MNRIIFARNHPTNQHLYSIGKVYDYPYNADDYACVNVDEEALCYLKLRHVVWEHTFTDNADPMRNMRTYVCHYTMPHE